jgi:hypothetical protein
MRVPDLLELWTELGQLGWTRAPLDAYFEATDNAMVSQKNPGKNGDGEEVC